MKKYKYIVAAILLILLATLLCAASTFVSANYSTNGGNAWVIGGGGRTGTLTIDTAGSLIFEGATADDYETTIALADPTADRTATFPDATGYVSITNVIALTTTTNLTPANVLERHLQTPASQMQRLICRLRLWGCGLLLSIQT